MIYKFKYVLNTYLIKMINDVPFIILREIILRLDYKLITTLKLLNKRLNHFITNDIQWKRQYLKFKYPNFKTFDDDNLEELIKLFENKSYLKLLETGFSQNDNLTVFVRPKDDSFIIYSKEIERGSFIEFYENSYKHAFDTTQKLYPIFSVINDEKINNLEYFLFSKDFYRIKTKDYKNIQLILKNVFTLVGYSSWNSSVKIFDHCNRFDNEMLNIIKK